MERKGVAVNSYHHVFNRGVERRVIFPSVKDTGRFIECMRVFNTREPTGSLLELRSRGDRKQKKSERLVDIVCFCINPNHFHMLIRQNIEKGMAEFIKRLSGGYTRYFNLKYKRSGVLFQGKYKSVPIETNEHLLHVSAYINLNDRVHQLGGPTAKSSWGEFVKGEGGFCAKEIVLSQFKDCPEYRNFALSSLKDILERKALLKDLEEALLE